MRKRRKGIGSCRVGSIYNMADAAVYVGTYAKYNNGSLEGEWVRLADFDSYEDFYEYLRELHGNERNPEFMFQDWENIPDTLISEHNINPIVWDILEHKDEYDFQAFMAYLSEFYTYGHPVDYDAFQDAFVGEYASMEDYALYCIEEGLISPDILMGYVDTKELARDLIGDGYTFVDGYVFQDN